MIDSADGKLPHPRPEELRFVDLCAGLGGFHHALTTDPSISFRCVLASEIDSTLAGIYPRNFPELEAAYGASTPRERVALLSEALEGDPLKAELPAYGPDGSLERIHGDMRLLVNSDQTGLRLWPDARDETDWLVPEHDLLCAGFPCQPFSKSGSQLGFDDLRGTIFHLIALVLEARRPALVLLENVGNFERHDGGNTWNQVRRTLDELGYQVAATRHKASEGRHAKGLLSPHHLGFAHHRERFFIVAQARSCNWLPDLNDRDPFPDRSQFFANKAESNQSAAQELKEVVSTTWCTATARELRMAQLSRERVTAIEHWSRLLDLLGEQDGESNGSVPRWRDTMPSFPIWGYELDPFQWYPIDTNPREQSSDLTNLAGIRERLLHIAADRIDGRSAGRVSLWDFPPRGERSYLDTPTLREPEASSWVESWPAYASRRHRWPEWKVRFIEQNRDWALSLWTRLAPDVLRSWLDDLFEKVPASSNQKLEWNCKREPLSIWSHVVQFRPSGIRVKRFQHVPALVAMTSTQIPVVPRLSSDEPRDGSDPRAKGRHLLPGEALRLQGFPADWIRPVAREAAFRAFGNAVHCGLVQQIVVSWLGGKACPNQLRMDLADEPTARSA